MDRCEWKAWFQAHHDGRTWTRIDSGFNQVKYNIAHTELMRRCTDGLEERGFDVAVEHQNEFRLKLQGATISGRPDLVADRGDEALIVDAKAALPSQAHQVQVMLYIMLLQLTGGRYREVRFPGRVYYGDTHAVDVPSSGVVDEFREVAKGLSETGGCERGPQEGPQHQRVPLLSHRQGRLPREGWTLTDKPYTLINRKEQHCKK